MEWKVREILQFKKLYRVLVTLKISNQPIIDLWITVEKQGVDKLSIKTSDNWEINNKDLKILLINELKYELKGKNYEYK